MLGEPPNHHHGAGAAFHMRMRNAPLPCLQGLQQLHLDDALSAQRAGRNALQRQGIHCGRPAAGCASAAQQCQVRKQWLAEHRQQQGHCYGKGAARRLGDIRIGCQCFDEAQTEALKTPAMWG